MKQLTLLTFLILLVVGSVFAQKGVDTQTDTITEKSGPTNKPTALRNINWGKDKTKVRAKLDNPYKLASRRDVLIASILSVLEEKKLIVDNAASKPSEGLIITQPVVFAKGFVISKNELNRYAELPNSETAWRSGRYSLRIEVVSIDGVQNNVLVSATVEGKADNGLFSEWKTVPTSGEAEDEFLVKLVEYVTGKVIDDPKN